jgi:serine protease Do
VGAGEAGGLGPCPLRLLDFDYLITKPKLEETDNFEAVVNAVTKMEEGALGEAAMRSLQRGDIIMKIGQKPVTSPAEAAAAVDAERKAGKDTVLMLVQRGTTPPRYIGIKLIPAKG